MSPILTKAGFAAFILATTMALFSSTPAFAEEPVSIADCPTPVIEQTTTPMRPYKSQFIERARAKSIMEPKNAEVIILGDSLAELWEVQKLEELIAPKRVLNLGIGGDRTQQVLWRLDQMTLEDYNPETVVMIIGTNNLGDGEPVCGIAAGIEKIVTRLAAHWTSTRFLFIQIPPRGVDFANYNPKRVQVSQMLKETLGDQIEILDLDSALTCGLEVFPQSYHDALAQCAVPQLSCPNYNKDLLHLAAPGYDVINAAVVEMISRH